MINSGAIEPIIDALITIVDVKAMYVNELNIVTPKIDNNIIFNKLLFIRSQFFIIEFKVNGRIIMNAKSHLKKLNFKGDKLRLQANFAVRKLPDQKKEAKISKVKAKYTLFCII